MMNMPAVNIHERKDDFLLSVAAPGLKKEDFKIQVEGNLIIISSEKEEDIENEDENYSCREYNYTSFERSFSLPDEVN